MEAGGKESWREERVMEGRRRKDLWREEERSHGGRRGLWRAGGESYVGEEEKRVRVR